MLTFTTTLTRTLRRARHRTPPRSSGFLAAVVFVPVFVIGMMLVAEVAS